MQSRDSLELCWAAARNRTDISKCLCKVSYFFWNTQAFLSSQMPFAALFRIIPYYTKLFALLLAYIAAFLYLCTNKQLLVNKIILIIHIYFLNKTIMQQNQCLTMGRTQLAQMYFPFIQPKSAWEKLRSLLQENPNLSHLTKLRRRTFLPAEVNIIYQRLGQPWAALFRPFSPVWLYIDQTPTLPPSNSHFP